MPASSSNGSDEQQRAATTRSARIRQDALDEPSGGRVQEFKMMTSGFSAAVRRYAGGMLSVVTKSGHQQAPGLGVRVRARRRPPTRRVEATFEPEKSDLSRHQFGAHGGRPARDSGAVRRPQPDILHGRPGVAAVDGRSDPVAAGSHPGDVEGDFTGAKNAAGQPISIIDPLTKQPFPNNQIPANRLNPVALNLVEFYPRRT